MHNFGKCERMVNWSCIVLKQKQSKITFINESQNDVRVIEIDDCVITNGLRCDYLVISNLEIEHFVELKGSDVNHAVKQLARTILQVSINPNKGVKYCFIISSRCPLLTAKIQNLKLMFKKKYNSILIIKNNKYEHQI